MGYETRIYFCKDYGFPENDIHHSAVVAMMDMCKMGYSDEVQRFHRCFDKETPFSIWKSGYNEELDCECMVDVIEDMYGARLKYASNKEELLDAIIEVEKAIPDYPRFKQLRKMIQAFMDDDSIYIVNYGY